MDLYWYAYLPERGLLLMQQNAVYGYANEGGEIEEAARKLYSVAKSDVASDVFVAALAPVLAMRYLDMEKIALKEFSSLGEVEKFFADVNVENAAASFFNGAATSKIGFSKALNEDLIVKKIGEMFKSQELIILPRDRARLASEDVSNKLPGVISARLKRSVFNQKSIEGYLRKGYDLTQI